MSADICDASTTTPNLLVSNWISDRGSVLGCVESGTRDADTDADPTGYFVNNNYRYNPGWLLYTTLDTGD